MKNHMRKKEFIILSAELTQHSKEVNEMNTRNLEACLQDLEFTFTKCKGIYKGSEEVSFMVIVKDEAEIECITDLGLKTFKQESVLFRDYKGMASLVFEDGTSKELGKFKKGKSLKGYTEVNSQGWIVA